MNITAETLPFNDQLRRERIRRNWRQQDLADKLHTTVTTIKRWERGSQQPSVYFRAKLCALFELNTEELGLLSVYNHPTPIPEAPTSDEYLVMSTLPEETPVWGVPFPRNPFFTGRDLVLDHIHTLLTHNSTRASLTQSYAFHGLGGIGKTQLVIEYAYRHRFDYRAILWVEADTQAALLSSMAQLATLLALPEQTANDQNTIVAAVLRWLNYHEDWLLIFDNVTDLSVLKPFLPANDQGALLFTTRLRTLGTVAQMVELAPMTIQEGQSFLLARTNRLHPKEQHITIDQQEVTTAQTIASEMGGLPLALEQAGAYINATQCSLADYLYLFQTMGYRLLDIHDSPHDHPLSVSRTFTLAFEQVEQRNPLAAEILMVCAFLAPEAIPETFFVKGAALFGPPFEALTTDPLAFSEAIKVLLSYSLLQRHATTQTITVHRLVQMVLKGRLLEAAQRTRMSSITQAMTNFFLSDDPNGEDWQRNKQLLPHVLLCIHWSEPDEYLGLHPIHISTELLTTVGVFLLERARFYEAEPLLQRALHTREQTQGIDHLDTAYLVNALANLYRGQGKYELAESSFQRALTIKQHCLGLKHPEVAVTLHNLALFYSDYGEEKQAESLFQQALEIWKQSFADGKLGRTEEISSTPNFTKVSAGQRKYIQAESLYLRVVALWKQRLGTEHPKVAILLHNLAILYIDQKNYELAEPLFQQVLSIEERHLDPEHPEIAMTLHNLAILYIDQGKYELAEPLLQRALTIRQTSLGPQHPYIAKTLSHLASVRQVQQHTNKIFSRDQQILMRSNDAAFSAV